MSVQDNFENGWKSAFEEAKLTPPANVWSNVRAEIAAGQAKKKSVLVIYWRWMAAASVTLLIGVGVGSYHYSQDMLQDLEILATREQKLLHNIAMLEQEKCDFEMQNLITDQKTISTLEDKNSDENEKKATNLAITNKRSLIAQGEIVNEVTAFSSTFEDKQASTPVMPKEESTNAAKIDLPVIVLNNSSLVMSTDLPKEVHDEGADSNADVVTMNELFVPESLVPLGTNLLAEISVSIKPQKVPDMMEIIKMQNGVKDNFKSMWAGLSIGGGSFDSNIGQDGAYASFAQSDALVEGVTADGQTVTNAYDINETSSETPAFSYAISADFGKQIGQRTFMQGGVEYSRYSSGATSNVSTNDVNNESQAFLRYENNAALDKGALTATDSYDVTNNFQYVAIPLRIGYQLLNRKVGISFSSGVSTNFFLKNTLKDKSGTRNEVEVTNGGSSPYKPLNFNGLLGAEISYQWNEQYQLAIVPDYRVSLDGVTKTDAFIQSKPTTFFLGFRFKYILK